MQLLSPISGQVILKNLTGNKKRLYVHYCYLLDKCRSFSQICIITRRISVGSLLSIERVKHYEKKIFLSRIGKAEYHTDPAKTGQIIWSKIIGTIVYQVGKHTF